MKINFSAVTYTIVSVLIFYLLFPASSSGASLHNITSEQKKYVFYTGAGSPLKEILEGRLKEAFRRIGKDFKLVFSGSAQRALLMANEEGDGDALRVPEIKILSPQSTENLLKIPEFINESKFCVYTKGTVFDVAGPESLQGYRNGFRRGIKFLEKSSIEKRTVLPNTQRLFQMLETGRLDTVIEHDIIADTLIRTRHLSEIKKLSPPLKEVQTFSFIHKKHRELIPKLVKVMIQMKSDGTFDKIKQDILLKKFSP